MQVGQSSGRDKVPRLNYRCLNKDCPRPRGSRSIRGKLIFDEIDDVIRKHLQELPDKAYDEYVKEMKSYSESAKKGFRSELARATTTKAGYEKRIADLSPSLAMLDDANSRELISKQIAELSQMVQKQEETMQKYRDKIARSTLPMIDKDQFQNTLKDMADKLKAADVFQKDIIVSNLF